MIGTNYTYTTLVENVAPGRAESGQLATPDAALGLAPLWEAVSLITGHVAGMEVEIMRRRGDRLEPVTTHPVYRLLNRAPNGFQTPFAFRELLMTHALIQGNGRAKILRNGLGQPVELVPMYPWQSWCVISDGEKYHVNYRNPDEPDGRTWRSSEGDVEVLHDRDVLHIPGLSYNGFWGMHLTQTCKEVLGNARAMQSRVGNSLGNMGMPGFLLEVDDNFFNAERRRDFRREWKLRYQGARNTGEMMMIPKGAKAHMASMTAQDAQLDAMADLTTEQIRRLFLLPPDQASAYKSITERNTQYIANCLHRWFIKWQQEIYAKLFSERERLADSHMARFNSAELIKGDLNSLADYTGKLRQQGIVSGNEARLLHGMNEVDDEALEAFSNPNITPGEPDGAESDAEEQDDTEDEDVEANDLASRAIAWSLGKILEGERKRLLHTSKLDDFAHNASDIFKDTRARIRDMCRALKIPSEDIIEQCETRHAEILEVAHMGEETIAATVNNWSLKRLSHVV